MFLLISLLLNTTFASFQCQDDIGRSSHCIVQMCQSANATFQPTWDKCSCQNSTFFMAKYSHCLQEKSELTQGEEKSELIISSQYTPLKKDEEGNLVPAQEEAIELSQKYLVSNQLNIAYIKNVTSKSTNLPKSLSANGGQLIHLLSHKDVLTNEQVNKILSDEMSSTDEAFYYMKDNREINDYFNYTIHSSHIKAAYPEYHQLSAFTGSLGLNNYYAYNDSSINYYKVDKASSNGCADKCIKTFIFENNLPGTTFTWKKFFIKGQIVKNLLYINKGNTTHTAVLNSKNGISFFITTSIQEDENKTAKIFKEVNLKDGTHIAKYEELIIENTETVNYTEANLKSRPLVFCHDSILTKQNVLKGPSEGSFLGWVDRSNIQYNGIIGFNSQFSVNELDTSFASVLKNESQAIIPISLNSCLKDTDSWKNNVKTSGAMVVLSKNITLANTKTCLNNTEVFKNLTNAGEHYLWVFPEGDGVLNCPASMLHKKNFAILASNKKGMSSSSDIAVNSNISTYEAAYKVAKSR
jgi:hypothetical protein